jgi:hypothetical protein
MENIQPKLNMIFWSLYLVQKYEKNAVANDKCIFATYTEFTKFVSGL